jgi:hypothetical protein
MAEYIAGTDPRDGNSKLETGNLTLVGGGFRISFESVVGRLYDVLYKDGLLDDTWLELVSDVAGTGEVMEITDPGSVDRRFYRVRVRLE